MATASAALTTESIRSADSLAQSTERSTHCSGMPRAGAAG